MSASNTETWLTVEELAAMIHSTPGGVYGLNYTGAGPTPYRVGRRKLYKLSEVTAWMESGRIEPAAKAS